MMPLGFTKDDQPPEVFSFKTGDPRIRSVIYMVYSFLKMDQVLESQA